MEVRYQLRYSPVNRIIWSRRIATAYRLQLPVRTNQPRRADLTACDLRSQHLAEILTLLLLHPTPSTASAK